MTDPVLYGKITGGYMKNHRVLIIHALIFIIMISACKTTPKNKGEQSMQYEIKQLDEMIICGPTTRTNNKEAVSVIPAVYKHFFENNVIGRIPDKVPSTQLYAAYTEYENDENGEYSFILGARVGHTDDNTTELIYKTIPAGKYAVFTVDSKEQVFGVWQYIWNNDLNRSYTIDFEVYDTKSDAVEIYIAVK